MDARTLSSPTVAIIGAGVAGAACVEGLRQAGAQVTLFDKLPAVGGRLSARRVQWEDADGTAHSCELDLGAQCFEARQPRWRALLARARARGVVAPWQPRLHTERPGLRTIEAFVPTPDMPALVRHLIGEVPLVVGQTVHRLQRVPADVAGGAPGRWDIVSAEDGVIGCFDAVLLALPAPQAAILLAGLHDDWADALAARPMAACWTLSAVTEDVDWRWDIVEPARGPLGWITRHDRKPGRDAPAGTACWVAHATTAWSDAHLEADPLDVRDQLCEALAAQMPGGHIAQWHHAAAHRWRYAVPSQATPPVSGGLDCWWDATQGLGVCSDVFAGGDVEAAWHSGDELADTVAAWLDQHVEASTAC